jgi:hypothetical protein
MKKQATSALLFLVMAAFFLAKVKWFPGFHPGR